jgi:hypothetical protein
MCMLITVVGLDGFAPQQNSTLTPEGGHYELAIQEAPQ